MSVQRSIGVQRNAESLYYLVFAFSLSSWEISNNTVNHVPKVQPTLSQRRHKIIRQSRDNTSCE
jgi:hypothetical protein